MIIDKEIESAYERTEYLLPNMDLVLRIGAHNEEMDTFLIDNQAQNFCIITAYNPQSQQIENQRNEIQQQLLKEDLESSGLRFCEVENTDPSGHWPMEPGYLVFDLTKEMGLSLALKYKQLAIVIGCFGAAPELAWAASDSSRS